MTSRYPLLQALIAASFLFLAACSDRPSPPTPTPKTDVPALSAAPASTDRWLGQWTGPEGTFLRLTGNNGSYEVGIQNLDGLRTFAGKNVADEIHFERDDKRETIRATDGPGTRMKWLADKKDCLLVRVGEGFCRD